MRLRVTAQCVADDHKQEVGGGNNQTHREPDRSLSAMRGDTQRHPDDCKRHTRERERKAFIDFGPAGAAFPLVLTF